VLSRGRLRRYITEADRDELLSLLREGSLVVEIGELPDICRDENDNYLLAMCEASDADYLVTRDEDCLRW